MQKFFTFIKYIYIHTFISVTTHLIIKSKVKGGRNSQLSKASIRDEIYTLILWTKNKTYWTRDLQQERYLEKDSPTTLGLHWAFSSPRRPFSVSPLQKEPGLFTSNATNCPAGPPIFARAAEKWFCSLLGELSFHSSLSH